MSSRVANSDFSINQFVSRNRVCASRIYSEMLCPVGHDSFSVERISLAILRNLRSHLRFLADALGCSEEDLREVFFITESL